MTSGFGRLSCSTATVIIVRVSRRGSAALTFKTKCFGSLCNPYDLLLPSPFTEGTESDSSMKAIASNQQGPCIKSEKEHMQPGESSEGGEIRKEKVVLNLNPDRKIN